MKFISGIKKVLIAVFCVILCAHSSIVLARNEKLENYTYIGEFSIDKAKLTLRAMPPPLNVLEPKYSLDLYKIHYITTAPNGDKTSASGLIAMPKEPKTNVAIVSFYHGTRVTRSDVPSNFKENYYIYPALFSSYGGYMIVMPDYLGLGDNNLPLHPYVQSKTLSSSSIDMVIAARELANVLNYPINDKLFLAGYSEGGFTTMVTYESLLKEHKEIPVTAVAPGSAPYDWKETVPFITLQPGPRASVYVAYFYYSMQAYYHLWAGLDVIFKKPYDTLIPILFDGNHVVEEILQSLPSDPHKLLQDAFFDSIVNGTEPHTDQMIENLNHYHFVSTSPLLLVGTKGDHDLPFYGAEIAYQQLKKLSDKVYIKSVSDVLDHIQAAPFVMKEQLDFFKRYEN